MTDEQHRRNKDKDSRPEAYDELTWLDFELYGEEIDKHLGGGL